MHPRIVTRLIRRCISLCLDFQLIRWLHENQSMIRDRTRIAADHVSVQIERACHRGSGGERQLSLAVREIDIARQ